MSDVRPLLTLTVLRRSCGVSQQALAAALGLFQSDVSKWENGEEIKPEQAELALKFLRLKNRKACRNIASTDLLRPWDEVLSKRMLKREQGQ